MSTGNAAANPECILPRYDIVFAKASCALQAMAVGMLSSCVISRGRPMVTFDKLDDLRWMNFGAGVLDQPHQPKYIEAEITLYDASDAAKVTRRIRDEASLTETVHRWIALYCGVMEEFHTSPQDFHRNFGH